MMWQFPKERNKDMEKEIRHIITQLKKGKIDIDDIPFELQENFDIIKVEREVGIRKLTKCGYDIISDRFFVEEEIKSEEKWDLLPPQLFDDFATYSDYLEGNIYENACYYQIPQEKLPDNIDKVSLFEKDAFIDSTIDDYTLSSNEKEKARYNEVEKKKPQIKRWIAKFNECTTYEQFRKIVSNYTKSNLSIDISFFFWNYIFADINDEARFQVIMKYMSSGEYPESLLSKALCLIYNPDKVVENYRYELGVNNTRRKHIREIERIAKEVKEKRYTYRRKKYFDQKTHYYCVKTGAFIEKYNFPLFAYEEYFETIEAFINRLNGDLRGCNLSRVQNCHYDFSTCLTDENSVLPIGDSLGVEYYLSKGYNSEGFYVKQEWEDEEGNIIKQYDHKFRYYFDFVKFLNGDLSDVDLVSCDGFKNLRDISKLNLCRALIPSSVCKQLKISYNKYELNAPPEITFSITEACEKEKSIQIRDSDDLQYQNERRELEPAVNVPDQNDERIYYISDLHLFHMLKNRGVENEADVIQIIRGVAESIEKESGYHRYILINGDTSLDSSVFELFLEELYNSIGKYKKVIFTIGNHDIWAYSDKTYGEIVDIYRSLLEEYGMYLLQNDVLYEDEDEDLKHICEQELEISDASELRAKTRRAKLLFFGGTGFSGYNPLFNASFGLYRNNSTIGYDRDFEYSETRKIEGLYRKICAAFCNKNVIIMTHMPLPDWYADAWKKVPKDYSKTEHAKSEYFINHPNDNIGIYASYQPGFVYVSGHTHRNYCYDDGKIRIYADNQFGYNTHTPERRPHLKSFDICKTYDYFEDCPNGIFEITANEYKEFYRGKNIMIDFNRNVYTLYMLKRDGYYCFIHESAQNQLCILNGGALKRLDNRGLNYYYENMDLVISLLKNPLDQYTALQKRISKEIQLIGGTGSVHGCIVDIDFYNHIYVNPLDGEITGYWASDIVNKKIYPTILALLEAECPQLFGNYEKLIEATNGNALLLLCEQPERKLKLMPVPYLDTDIYRASRQIRKMQKLNSNILSTWPAKLPERKAIESLA